MRLEMWLSSACGLSCTVTVKVSSVAALTSALGRSTLCSRRGTSVSSCGMTTLLGTNLNSPASATR